jgi:hypothetical protein
MKGHKNHQKMETRVTKVRMLIMHEHIRVEGYYRERERIRERERAD